MSSEQLIPPEAEADITRMMDLRGAILIAFANFEYFLARLIVEASRMGSYRHIDLSFSENADRRAARLKSVLNEAGPLSQYSAELRPAIDAVLEFSEFRNFAAHGVTIHSFQNDAFTVNCFMYKMFKGGNLAEGSARWTMDEYLRHTVALTASVKAFTVIIKRIWAQLALPKLGTDPF